MIYSFYSSFTESKIATGDFNRCVRTHNREEIRCLFLSVPVALTYFLDTKDYFPISRRFLPLTNVDWKLTRSNIL